MKGENNMASWSEMAYARFSNKSQHERLSDEFEKDIDIDDFDIYEFLNDYDNSKNNDEEE